MDEELHHTNIEREGDATAKILNDEDAHLSVDVNIVSNMLESLEAQGAGSGPVSNVLNEFGLALPDRQSPQM